MKTTATAISTGHTGKDKSVSAPVRRSTHAIKSSVIDKTHRHPWENRKALSEEYETEQSGREGWWRTYIRETPIPGSYECEAQGLLYDIEKRPNTYRFKSDGRKVDPHPHGKGKMLLPGLYEHQDFLTKFEKNPATYNFKTGERAKHDILNFGKKDKDINVSPDAYYLENYLSMSADRQPSKHGVFKSQSRRFPTLQFRPKDGPAPGNYESHTRGPAKIVISSSFKSRTPRFGSSHTKVPGPGSYERTFQAPQTGVLQKMGRQHGLFFSSAFQV